MDYMKELTDEVAFAKAHRYFTAALKQFREVNHIVGMAECNKHLSKSSFKAGNKAESNAQ